MKTLTGLALQHLQKLTVEIEQRNVGSSRNLNATDYFKQNLKQNNWSTESQKFQAFKWINGGVRFGINEHHFTVKNSPYSKPCNVEGKFVVVSTLNELELVDATDKILIVKDELANEQLMPKQFPYNNPIEHKEKVYLLEQSNALAIVFIVNKTGHYEGGEYPFPIIEDGDFDIPSVFMSEEESEDFFDHLHEHSVGHLIAYTDLAPSKGYNVIGKKGKNLAKHIVVTAHIDTKPDSPGAIDNATGVVILLLISDMLKYYTGPYLIELVALNGEYYYTAPGQMKFLDSYDNHFEKILLNINVDGVGLKNGKTALSFYNIPNELEYTVKSLVTQFEEMEVGIPWYQGNHGMFVKHGVPAMAATSGWLINNLAAQDITHTKNDNISIVDIKKVVETAEAISYFIEALK